MRKPAIAVRRVAAAMLPLTLAVAGYLTAALAQNRGQEITVEGQFGGKKGKAAKDLSGIACRPGAGGEYLCLVVNDESAFAQLATLRDGRLVAGATLDMIAGRGPSLADDKPPAGVFGSEAAARPVAGGRCPDRSRDDDFDEFDGEGVAWAPASHGGGGFFYVVGSHACGRGSEKRRRSTYLLARFRVDEAGRVAEPPDLTWRLGEALKQADKVSPYYGLPLTPEKRGLDIEGIAAFGEHLFFGLRAPSTGDALIVRARADDLFSNTANAPATRTFSVPLGERTGIRDLAALPDGRLLVLSGASQDQPGVSQALSLVVPSDAAVWPPKPLLSEIQLPRRKAKAEGVAVLDAGGGKLKTLVLFEDPSEDRLREYVLDLPR